MKISVNRDAVPRLLEDREWTHEMFTARIRATALRQQLEGENQCGCGGTAYNGRYTQFAQDLRRFRNKKHPWCEGYKLGRGPLEDGLHILVRGSLPGARLAILRRYYALKELTITFCSHGLVKVLKEQTACAKMGGGVRRPALAAFLLLGAVIRILPLCWS